MAGCLRAHSALGPWLVVDDEPETVASALAGRPDGAVVEVWRRRGELARAWPPAGPFRAASLRLPPAREAFAMALHAVAARLEPRGELFVYGANDEGIRSAGHLLEPLFDRPETVETRRHCRVWRAVGRAEPERVRGELEDWRLCFDVELPGGGVRVVSYPGLFAHGRLDEGTGLLIAALPRVAEGERWPSRCGGALPARGSS
jgi:16S rRNA (guanine1207-N2)-methyltransferase